MKNKVLVGILFSPLILLIPSHGLAQWANNGSDLYYTSGSVVIGRSVVDGTGTAFGKAILEVTGGYTWLQGEVLGWLAPVAILSTDNPKEWDFDQGGTQVAQFTAQGNFLIGKTSQSNTSFKLDVNGPARSTQMVVVATNTADYVFDSSYKLLSLPEVNAFIAKNHHLEGIASAKEMKVSGLDLDALVKRLDQLTAPNNPFKDYHSGYQTN